MNIEAYSDGSGTSKDKSGGYGYVIVVDGSKVDEGNGHLDNASNNDCELRGAIEALKAAYKFIHKPIDVLGTLEVVDVIPPQVILVSDSQIILNWAAGTNRFKQLDKMNQYETLRALVLNMKVETRWVKGHSGDEHNERCDRLANAARLGTEVGAPKKRKNKIGKRTEGIYTFDFNGNIKVIDIILNKCEDYNVKEHGDRIIAASFKEE